MIPNNIQIFILQPINVRILLLPRLLRRGIFLSLQVFLVHDIAYIK